MDTINPYYQMDFQKYRTGVRSWTKKTEELAQQIYNLEAEMRGCTLFRAYVHGIWKRYSQAAEAGHSTFTMIVNTTTSQLFSWDDDGCEWTISDFVSKIEDLSFVVEYAEVDPDTLTALDTTVRGPDVEGVYVLRFHLDA